MCPCSTPGGVVVEEVRAAPAPPHQLRHITGLRDGLDCPDGPAGLIQPVKTLSTLGRPNQSPTPSVGLRGHAGAHLADEQHHGHQHKGHDGQPPAGAEHERQDDCRLGRVYGKCVCLSMCACECKFVCVFVRVCMHTCTCVPVWVYMCVYVSVRAHVAQVAPTG